MLATQQTSINNILQKGHTARDLHAFVTKGAYPGMGVCIIQAVSLAHSFRARWAVNTSVEDPAEACTTASALFPRPSRPVPHRFLSNAIP